MYGAWPKQLEFHQRESRNLLATGNRGGGKSHMLRHDAHMRAMSVPGINLILIRKTYKQLQQSHLIHIAKEMKLLGGRYHATDYVAHYPNGSRLFFSYVGHEGDAMNLLSAEFAGAYFDELSVIPWEYFLKLCASVRVTVDMPCAAVVRAATNPLGESAAEVNKYFVTKDVDPDEDADYLPDEWDHIRVDMKDNPSIDVEDYKKRFAGLSDHVKRAWLDGEFSDEESLFAFFPNKHGKPYHVINDIPLDEIATKCPIYRVFDWGWSPDPSYCAWIAHIGNRYIVIHEKVWYKTIASDIAAEMKEVDKHLGLKNVVTTYCDPTLTIHNGVDYRTVKDVFEENGIPMEPSINNREQFAAAIHAALAEEAAEGVPRLQIYADPSRKYVGAPYMAKTIPLMRYDEKKPLALADHRHDHPSVSLAYFLISHGSYDRHEMNTRELPRWMRPKLSPHAFLGAENVK